MACGDVMLLANFDAVNSMVGSPVPPILVATQILDGTSPALEYGCTATFLILLKDSSAAVPSIENENMPATRFYGCETRGLLDLRRRLRHVTYLDYFMTHMK